MKYTAYFVPMNSGPLKKVSNEWEIEDERKLELYLKTILQGVYWYKLKDWKKAFFKLDTPNSYYKIPNYMMIGPIDFDLVFFEN